MNRGDAEPQLLVREYRGIISTANSGVLTTHYNVLQCSQPPRR